MEYLSRWSASLWSQSSHDHLLKGKCKANHLNTIKLIHFDQGCQNSFFFYNISFGNSWQPKNKGFWCKNCKTGLMFKKNCSIGQKRVNYALVRTLSSSVDPFTWPLLPALPAPESQWTASFTAVNSPVSALAFLCRIKWGFMEAASHWTKPFLFQFGLTALFIPCRFQDRRLGAGGWEGGGAVGGQHH